MGAVVSDLQKFVLKLQFYMQGCVALALALRVQALALTLRVQGLGLEGPGLGGLEGPGLGLVGPGLEGRSLGLEGPGLEGSGLVLAPGSRPC